MKSKVRLWQQNKLQYGLYSLLAFIMVFVLNKMTLYTADDYTYRFIYKSSHPYPGLQKIHGVKSIIESQISHYQLWNGRFVAHSIVQFFMQYNKLIFDICNSLAFIGLSILICKIISKLSAIKVKGSIYLLTLLLLWMLLPELGKTILWVSGSGNYLWTALFYVGFLLFILYEKTTNFLSIIVAVILGFFAGATNENSGPAIILMAGLFFLSRFCKEKRIKVWEILCIVSSCAGFILMMKSPGSQARGEMQLAFWILKKNLITVYQEEISHFFFGYLLFIILFGIVLYLKRMTKKDLEILTIFLIGHLAGIYCLIFSPEAPLRTFFGPSIFLVIMIVYLFNKLEEIILYKRILFSLLIFYTLLTYSFAIQDIYQNFIEVNQQVEILKKANKNQNVNLKMLSPSDSLVNPYNGTRNLSTNKNAWFNSWMASYFKVKTITGVPRK